MGEYVKYSILRMPKRVLDYTTSACEVLNLNCLATLPRKRGLQDLLRKLVDFL